MFSRLVMFSLLIFTVSCASGPSQKRHLADDKFMFQESSSTRR